jgi:hypothetical protein
MICFRFTNAQQQRQPYEAALPCLIAEFRKQTSF